ncbi:hypothetical protein ACFQS7_20710 [Dankookia sp. GCM10030260]|uniref:hypothetical protein n=1 Tax=Dankookia sp. GCM10030260 TaxID=3273390 RepID=UPI003613522F
MADDPQATSPPPGTPATGETPCPDCQGKARIGGQPCRACGGGGIVIQGVAGG